MKLPNKRSRFWPTLATVIGVSAGIALGNWQLDRGAQKRAIKARYDTLAAQPPIQKEAERRVGGLAIKDGRESGFLLRAGDVTVKTA